MTASPGAINRAGRWGLAFVFFYHGLVPKILWLSSIERALVEAHALPLPAAVFPAIAGGVEILLALFIIGYRASLVPVYIAASFLVVLLADTAWAMPALLIAAFGPVSTNIAALTLCYVIYLSQPRRRAATQADCHSWSRDPMDES